MTASSHTPRRLIVTGANGALGRAVVEALRLRGDTVAAIQRPAPPHPTADCTIACADLADPRASRTAIEDAIARLGGLDGLICLAGAFAWAPLEQADAELWSSLFTANVMTARNAIHAALPHLRDGASIICIGAASAEPAGPGMAPYAAAKSGVARLVEALADELGPRGIRVNAVLPRIIDTPANRADMPDADPADWTSPQAISDAIAWLTTHQARAISGALIPVTHNR